MSPGVSEVLQLFWYSVIQKYHSRCFVYYLSDQKIFRLSSINVLSVLYFYQVLTAILPDGQENDVIRDGKFVVPGTEELNKPLES